MLNVRVHVPPVVIETNVYAIILWQPSKVLNVRLHVPPVVIETNVYAIIVWQPSKVLNVRVHVPLLVDTIPSINLSADIEMVTTVHVHVGGLSGTKLHITVSVHCCSDFGGDTE